MGCLSRELSLLWTPPRSGEPEAQFDARSIDDVSAELTLSLATPTGVTSLAMTQAGVTLSFCGLGITITKDAVAMNGARRRREDQAGSRAHRRRQLREARRWGRQADGEPAGAEHLRPALVTRRLGVVYAVRWEESRGSATTQRARLVASEGVCGASS